MAVAAACFRAKLAGQSAPAGERTARVLAGYRRTARYSFMGTRGGSGHAALPCISARFRVGTLAWAFFALVGLALCFLNVPIHPSLNNDPRARAGDLVLAVLAACCCGYIVVQSCRSR